jgi:hypothetical protein
MASLKSLYLKTGVSAAQRNAFWKKVRETKSKALQENKNDKEKAALYLLQHLWSCYDMGGISVGRSLRALLLEHATKELREGKKKSPHKILATLVAMYHDQAHIRRWQWYDFPVADDDPYSSSLTERIFLCSAVQLLELRGDIPDVSVYTHDDFRDLVKRP